MEGKKIVKVLELENGYIMLRFDNGEIAIVKVVTPDLKKTELSEFLGEEDTEDEEDQDEEDEEDEDEEEEDEDEEEEDEDEEDYIWDDLVGMNYKQLSKFCKENDLETDPSDFDKEEIDEFRAEVAEELDIEVPDEEEEEEEEEEDDNYTWDDLKESDFDELSQICTENDLETDPDDFEEENEDKLRRAIAKELGIEPPKKSRKKK